MQQEFMNRLADKAVKWLRKHVGNLTVGKFVIMLCCCGVTGFVLDRVVEMAGTLEGLSATVAVLAGGVLSAVLSQTV